MFLRRKGNWQNVQTFAEIIAPSSQKLESMCFSIYITPNIGTQYVRYKDGKYTVTQIGQLLIHISNPNNLSREQQSVDVTISFSGTELQASAKCHWRKCCL